MKKTQTLQQPLFSDKVMAKLHEQVLKHAGPFEEYGAGNPDSYFWELCESIIGQQLSEKVAPIIRDRVKALLKNEFTPEAVLRVPDADFRAAGMSFAKISYIKNVAKAWQSGHVKPAELAKMDDEAVIALLTEIKGVGRWTAEMFLIFRLGRKDIFSAGDFALRKAIIIAYGLPEDTKQKDFMKFAERWQPHRSTASRVLWGSLDVLGAKKAD